MEKLRCIAIKNLKMELLPHLILTILIVFVTPAVFSLKNLDEQLAAIPLETIISLSGIILLVPLFFPEKEPALLDIMYTKTTSLLYVFTIRAVYSILLVLLIPAVFQGVLYLLNSEVTLTQYLGTVSGALFMGATGMLCFAVTNNIAAAYMIPVIWYVMCMGAGDKMGRLDVLMMTHGHLDEKYLQMGLGVLMILLAVAVKSRHRQ